MIRHEVEVYVRIFKVTLVLALGAGLTIGGIERETVVAKKALVPGLVKIPTIRR
jgi:hypothetical protein